MMPVALLRSPMVNIRLNERLAPFLALPEHQGGTWHLTTYQGRKTFSRFIGRRDRTGLTALQRHLGHVHRAMTDRAYVGTDFRSEEHPSELHSLIRSSYAVFCFNNNSTN